MLDKFWKFMRWLGGVEETPVVKQASPDSYRVLVCDPTTPDLVAHCALPETPKLSYQVVGFNGQPGAVDSIEEQAAHCHIVLANAINYAFKHLRNPIAGWPAANTLLVMPRAGKQLNAYYDRQSLRFFFDLDPVTRKMVYSADSTHVVSHEFGHGLLDCMRPDMWNLQSLEAWAFHEAFGDCIAILSVLQYEEAMNRMLEETVGNLRKSNVVSRLAVEMGTAICHMAGGRHGYTEGPLRNAVNDFKYVQPETLPQDAPVNALCQEPHSFSRVWTGAWYEMLVSMYEQEVRFGTDAKSALIKARDASCNYLFWAIPIAPATPRFFESVANGILLADNASGGKYQQAIQNVFVARNILQRDKIKTLSAKTWDSINDSLKFNDEILKFEGGTAIRITNTEEFKLKDHIQGGNPLYNLSIEVPSEKSYHFNAVGDLVGELGAITDELIQSATACLDFLHNKNLVSDDPETPFEVTEGKLVRSHFACDTFRNNSEIPGGPEYQKPWKPKNNSGCCPNCNDDPPPAPPVPPKIGCVIGQRAGNGAIQTRVGQAIRRKVC